MTFKESAIEILKQSGVALHYREIANRALDQHLIEPEGLTPWATMSAQLSTDVALRGEESDFIRADPGFYALNPAKHTFLQVANSVHTQTFDSVEIKKVTINPTLTSRQKGDIGEARVAELVTLYGLEGLSCYRPISDDEGIDLIVKRRGQLESLYIQVKTSYGNNDRGFVSTVKERNILDKSRMILVFVYFDLVAGDLSDHVFCIPAPDFLRLTKNENKGTGDRVFTVGLKNPDQSKYAEYLIEKRELAARLTELMDRLR